jgi:ATP-binding cassette subfamily B protein RaxB
MLLRADILLEKRSLIRQPRMLFPDEGTAHLDVDNEMQINESLRHLSMTRISVAHRPEMSNGADRIIRVGQTPTMQLAPSPN